MMKLRETNFMGYPGVDRLSCPTMWQVEGRSAFLYHSVRHPWLREIFGRDKVLPAQNAFEPGVPQWMLVDQARVR